MYGVMVAKMSVVDGRWWLWVGSQVLRSMGQRGQCFGAVFSDTALRSCSGTDGVSMSPVFSAIYALEVLCGKQVSCSHSIYPVCPSCLCYVLP